MAITERYKSQLRMIQLTGTDTKTGRAILKTKTFSNVKADSTAAQMLTAAEAIASLQKSPLSKLERRDDLNIRKA